MRDILTPISAWFDAGRPFALATVVHTWQSSPRQPGAALAVSDDGEAVGSVSGGCVEGAVYEVAREVLATGVPRLETYGVTDDDAFAVGLTCGGTLQVFVERIDRATFPDLAQVRDAVAGRRPVAVVTVIGPGAPAAGRHVLVEPAPPGLPGPRADAGVGRSLVESARGLLARGRTAVVGATRAAPGATDADGAAAPDGVTAFVESMPPAPTMFVYGAIDFAAALVRTAKLLGHHVVVCDARAVFATARRFPEADEVVVAWPHEHLQGAVDREEVDERAVVCVLTHDPTFDVPLLQVALASRAGYVGAMGSRATHRDRVERLRDVGVGDAGLERLSSPIGLDLGARTPEETAVSIAAEIIATRWGGTGRRLREVDAPIHR